MVRRRGVRPAWRSGLAVMSVFLVTVTALPGRTFADSPNEIVQLPRPSTAVRANARLEAAALAWLNRMRTEQHLLPLRLDAGLQTAAQAYGRDMFVHGYLSHVAADGRTLEDRLGGFGRFNVIGENLAYAPDIEAADSALWHSEPHRRNILYPVFRFVGIAVIDGGDDGVVVVEDFADVPSAAAAAAPQTTAEPVRGTAGSRVAPNP
jgi:uncharacterized protein YkwD